MRVCILAALAASCAATASAAFSGHEARAAHLQARHAQLAARNSSLDKRGLIGDILNPILGPILGNSGRCPSSFKCNGSGNDGYDYDSNGRGRPSWAPSGFKYFGSSHGWLPAKNWQCGADWSIPSQCDIGKATWWAPTSVWKSSHLSLDLGNILGFIPSWWDWIKLPLASWRCDGSGNDGWDVDYNGNNRPSWAPSSFLYFGGFWGPPKGWISPDDWAIPGEFLNACGKATWWKPSAGWLKSHCGAQFSITLPSWWGLSFYPARNYECRGDGKDGFEFDWQGSKAPLWVPSGWKWFGTIGWNPVFGWNAPVGFKYPIEWDPSKCGWWTPPPNSMPTTTTSSFVKTTTTRASSTSTTSTSVEPSKTSTPYPDKDWQAGGDHDGQKYDYNGNTCPSDLGEGGWLWYGTNLGWLPNSAWDNSQSWFPSQKELQALEKCSWWYPDPNWLLPDGIKGLNIWIQLGWVDKRHTASSTTTVASSTTTTTAAPSQTANPEWPSKEWQCRGDGWDGKPFDFDGKTCPSTLGQGSWQWFGTKYGWAPSPGWDNTPEWVPSSSELEILAKITWWYPDPNWLLPDGIKGLQVWIDAGWVDKRPSHTTSSAAPTTTSTPRPDPKWQCDGSGNDGKEVDFNGDRCPDKFGAGGWLWWGSNIGWAPHYSWDLVGWKPSTDELLQCGKVNWWYPDPDFVLPGGALCPLTWTFAGWLDLRKPSSDYVCSNTGEDGYDFDHQGNKRPSGYALGFRWFGLSKGWQPCAGFKLPSAGWTPPGDWDARGATWWVPNTKWTVPSSFKCPTFWPKNLLLGTLGSLLWW
ncbi:uncharacterized protein JCM10292_005694 [Rhodotorula paludigena]|uniref:uncharacterized protein n=1 Tax=Rhodotorula paludigena TaxID=86838 RepID=UPI00317C6372